ncbi:MAG TPA: redoxin domain-containing protein [Candidatus Binatia bacterium]|nr:redoxin domain-containing protein [Candidatus Binatia bacterium]
MALTARHPGIDVGDVAPPFTLPSLRGAMIDLTSYRGKRNVVVWFSRGFTCPFCRAHTDGMRAGYAELQAADTEVIQVAPNPLDAARRFFGPAPLPFPVICDPDKWLYTVYGLGERGALEATKTAVVSFAHAFAHGDGTKQIRGAYVDVMNRDFLRRLQHHAASVRDQGMFLVDKRGVVRHRTVVGPIEPMPDGADIASLVRERCEVPTSGA